jgi:hypothetical protein
MLPRSKGRQRSKADSAPSCSRDRKQTVLPHAPEIESRQTGAAGPRAGMGSAKTAPNLVAFLALVGIFLFFLLVHGLRALLPCAAMHRHAGLHAMTTEPASARPPPTAHRPVDRNLETPRVNESPPLINPHPPLKLGGSGDESGIRGDR